jgi:type 1 glutamine amidotransferase
VIHAGTSRYDHLPALTTLIGGAFVRHPEPCAVTLAPLRKNALTREVSAFTERDEHYFVNLSAPDAGVFLRSTSAHGAQPAGWTRTPGAGRVCVLTPGHNQAVWRHPSFQKLLLNSARWAAKLN